ncbi:MAG: rhamnulose-1-phosphate aldolase [Eggerthellaceae bacterium]|nr:rhamnulose-1-phosphate aldolase [Eggerthellaceae bacterium]
MESQSIFDRGVAKVKSVVSEMSIEQRDFMKAIVRCCNDGWLQGWHESNGGNLSYRMSYDELQTCRSYFAEPLGEWVPIGIRAAGLAGEHFVVTGAGAHFRNIALDPIAGLGIVEINQTGDAYRCVWGFRGGKQPTSEFSKHFMIHAVRKAVTKGTSRVVYHAHPAYVVALSLVLPHDMKQWSRVLWQSLSESILMFPEGIGIVPKMAPGTTEIADAISKLFESFSVVVWPHHGAFCSADDLDAAFGLMHTVEKAAGIYLQARMAKADTVGPVLPTDDELRALAQSFGVELEL